MNGILIRIGRSAACALSAFALLSTFPNAGEGMFQNVVSARNHNTCVPSSTTGPTCRLPGLCRFLLILNVASQKLPCAGPRAQPRAQKPIAPAENGAVADGQVPFVRWETYARASAGAVAGFWMRREMGRVQGHGIDVDQCDWTWST